MPTRITIAAEDTRKATAELTCTCAPSASDSPEGGTGFTAFTPSGSGSALDLFMPKGGASSPTPRFGLTRQAAKTFSSNNFRGVHDGRSEARGIQNFRGVNDGRSNPPSQLNGDIVASPRLIGYVLNFIASLICMVSAIKFERLSQQHDWFDLLVYFSDGRIDHNLTISNPDMNRSSRNITRLLFAIATNEEQQYLSEGPVASNIFEASMLYDVAVIVGGPENRLFNPYDVRLLQADQFGNADNQTSESTPSPTSQKSTPEIPTHAPITVPEERKTTTPTIGPTILFDSVYVTDVPTLLGIKSSMDPTFAPTILLDGNANESVGNESSSSSAPSAERHILTAAPSFLPTASAPSAESQISIAAPTLLPTASNLTAISPIIDEKSRPIRAVDYWVC